MQFHSETLGGRLRDLLVAHSNPLCFYSRRMELGIEGERSLLSLSLAPLGHSENHRRVRREQLRFLSRPLLEGAATDTGIASLFPNRTRRSGAPGARIQTFALFRIPSYFIGSATELIDSEGKRAGRGWGQKIFHPHHTDGSKI